MSGVRVRPSVATPGPRSRMKRPPPTTVIARMSDVQTNWARRETARAARFVRGVRLDLLDPLGMFAASCGVNRGWLFLRQASASPRGRIGTIEPEQSNPALIQSLARSAGGRARGRPEGPCGRNCYADYERVIRK